ncbi:MAG: hypothetical protein ABIS69_00040 [Sediminibacterium sp.]
MMEGVTSEAASLAGHLELGNLIYLYDDNHISIEGTTGITFTEDVAKRFESYNWHVQVVEDGNDIAAIANAVRNARAETQRPSLIKVRTQIAYGSPNKVNTAGAHGSPLGEEEIKLVKSFFGFDPAKSFVVPEEVLAYYRAIGEKGVILENKWQELFAGYKEKYPELAAEYERASKGQLPEDWQKELPVFEPSEKKNSHSPSIRQSIKCYRGEVPQPDWRGGRPGAFHRDKSYSIRFFYVGKPLRSQFSFWYS